AVQRSLVAGVDEAARQRARDVALLVETGQLPEPIPVEAGIPLVQVVDTQDRVLAASPGGDRLVPLLLPADVVAVRNGDARTVAGARLGIAGDLHVVGEPAGEDRTVVVAMSLAEVSSALAVVRPALFGGVPVLVGAFALACWVLVGQTLRPVAALRRGAEEITTTREARRLPMPAANDEIHRLSVTLNDMLDRLERSSARQRAFIADAAHELRSPLAAIRTQLEVGRAHPDSTDWTQVSADALTDLKRLSRLVDDLLLLARMDEVPPQRTVDVDLVDVADAVVQRFRGSELPVLQGGEASAPVAGDAEGLGRVVANLVENAVRHASSAVRVDVRVVGDHAELVVADDGPGVPVADRGGGCDQVARLGDAGSGAAGRAGLGPAVRPGQVPA